MKSSKMPPKINPSDAVNFTANALAENKTPSRRSPTSSSCSSAMSANIEFRQANTITAKKAVIDALKINTTSKAVEPCAGNQLTPLNANTIGKLTLNNIMNALPISVGFLSKRFVTKGIAMTDRNKPTKLPIGTNFSCSVVIPQK